ncbi:MAG: hypothetical protein WC549_08955 [Actinomycetota bacterium]
MISLTRQSKKIVIFSSILIGLLIISSIIMFVFWLNNRSGNSLLWILIVIIFFALISAVLMIILIVKRRGYSSFLRNDYYEVYERIAAALENSTLSIFERKEILLDISELLLQAQEKKRPVNSVIENNIEDFIERIKLSYGYRNGIVFNILSGIQNLLFVLTIVQAAIYLIRNTNSFFEVTMGLMMLPYMFLLSFLLLPLLKYLISRQKIIWFIIALVGLVSLFLGSNELLRRFGSNIAWVQTYFEKEITFISSWFIVIILILVMVLSWLAKWFMRRQSIKKMKAAW